MTLGAGRERLDSVIDPGVGLIFEKKVGDRVEAGERICVVCSNDSARSLRARDMLRTAISVSPEQVSAPPLIHETL